MQAKTTKKVKTVIAEDNCHLFGCLFFKITKSIFISITRQTSILNNLRDNFGVVTMFLNLCKSNEILTNMFQITG